MKINKKTLLISSAILTLIGISILLYFLLPNIFMSKEERFLNSFMGDYITTEYAFPISPELLTSPYEEIPYKTKRRFHFDKQRYAAVSGEQEVEAYTMLELIEPVKYTCVKIDDDFFNNGIKPQGGALRALFQKNSDFHEQVKEDAFAIFVRTPATEETYPEYKDNYVFYYIDGKYYIVNFTRAYFMEKIR